MYVGGSLTTLFDDRQRLETKRALVNMCQKGADRMAEVAVLNTPVRTGRLRTSWYRTPVRPATDAHGQSGVSASVNNDQPYAAWVESGTGIYGPNKRPIVAKTPGGVMAWRGPNGEWIYARSTRGMRGNHMLAIAANVVEAEVRGDMFAGILEIWQRKVEAGAK